MAAGRLQILDAQIVTRKDGVVVDTFRCRPRLSGRSAGGAMRIHRRDDRRGVDRPPIDRRRDAARCPLHLGRSLPAHRQPAEVRIDNETSDRFTILDVLRMIGGIAVHYHEMPFFNWACRCMRPGFPPARPGGPTCFVTGGREEGGRGRSPGNDPGVDSQ